MLKFPAESYDATAVRKFLADAGFKRLRVRYRADMVTIESGPTKDPLPHARLRRVSVHLWRLEMPTHTGRWQPTPVRTLRDDVLKGLVEMFPWTLANPERTSDQQY